VPRLIVIALCFAVAFVFVAGSVLLTEWITYAVKLVFARRRPAQVDPSLGGHIPLPRSHSFPSSHASMGMVGLLTMGSLYPGSIPALALFQPVLDDPAGYIAGGGQDNKIYLGVLLELLLIIANVGTAVVLYPIVRRQSEILSIGYFTARLMECVFIAAGILCVLGIVSLGQDDPNASALAVSREVSAVARFTSRTSADGGSGDGEKPTAFRNPATPPSVVSTSVRTLFAPSATLVVESVATTFRQ